MMLLSDTKPLPGKTEPRPCGTEPLTNDPEPLPCGTEPLTNDPEPRPCVELLHLTAPIRALLLADSLLFAGGTSLWVI